MVSDGPVHYVIRWSRRIGIAIVGGLVLAVGIAMIVLPGPAFIVIPMGLGILSLEFERPRLWLAQVRARAAATSARLRRKHRAHRGN